MSRHPTRTRRTVLAAASALLALVASPAAATIYQWDLVMTPDQVNNAGPTGNPDGSVPSEASGTARFTYDSEADRMDYRVSYEGLDGDLSALHVHGPATPEVSVMGHIFDIFRLGTDIPGDVDRTADTVEGSFEDFLSGGPCPGEVGVCDDPDAALAALVAGNAYLNVHSDLWPRGEIRGNFGPARIVPEPGTALLVAAGALALAARRRCAG